eukprot:COSAG06_NODE_60171_length_271_cov_6.918605_1_plen_43_part_01
MLEHVWRSKRSLIYDKKNNINEMIITIIGFQEEETASKNQTEP